MIELTTESLEPELAKLGASRLIAFSLACAERCAHAWDGAHGPMNTIEVGVATAELNEILDRLWTNLCAVSRAKSWEFANEHCRVILPNYDAGDEATLGARVLEDSVLTLMHAIRCTIAPAISEATAAASTARSCVYEWHTRDLPPTVWGPMHFADTDVNMVTVEIAAQMRDAKELAARSVEYARLRERARYEKHRFV